MGNVPNFNKEKSENLGGKVILNPLTKALKQFCMGSYYGADSKPFFEELKKINKKPLHELNTVDEFLNKKLLRSLTELVGADNCKKIEEMVRIRAKGQFSSSALRRSFHSSNFGYYAANTAYALRQWIVLLGCYDVTMEEMLQYDTSWVRGYSDYLALEINRNNPFYINAAKDMILGDNTALLSREMIVGIIRSDNDELKDLLLKLLLAARGQEGLRQAILESADCGDLNTFKKIFGCCIENDIFRFTSAARALYTWTGLYIEDVEIKNTRAIAEKGWQCLTDMQKRQEYLESDNPFDMYFALWAKGCEEVADADGMLNSLLNAREKHKKLLGWYYVQNIENSSYRHRMAVEHLDEEDITVLACVTDNLYVNRNTCCFYDYSHSKEYKSRTFPDSEYDADVKKRRELFYKLKPIAEMIGSNEWVKTGYLFPWSKLVINQKNAHVLPCMFSLAGYDLDPEMIDELYGLRNLMDSDLRRSFYVNFLDPDKNKKHREYVYDGLKDKSIYNKQAALEKLKTCRINSGDVERVCAMLTTKSSVLKKSVLDFLKGLKPDNQTHAIQTLLSGDENFLQAAFELLLENRDQIEDYRDVLEQLDAQAFSDQTKVLLNQLGLSGNTEDSDKKDGLKFGLFNEGVVIDTLTELGKNNSRAYLSEKELLSMFPKTEEVLDLVDRIRQVFIRHADYEYEIEEPDGSRRKILLGDSSSTYYSYLYFPAQYGKNYRLKQERTAVLDMLPFADEFKKELSEYIADPPRMAMLCYLLSAHVYYDNKLLMWFSGFNNKFNPGIPHKCFEKYGLSVNRCLEVIKLGIKEVNPEEVYKTLSAAYFSLCNILKEEKLSDNISAEEKYYSRETPAGSHVIFSSLRALINSLDLSDGSFDEWFKNEYYLERRHEYSFADSLGLDAYLRAVERKLIPLDCLYDWLLFPDLKHYSGGPISVLTNANLPQNKALCAKYQWLCDFTKGLVGKMVSFEAKRGQSETEISSKMREIRSFEGKEYFVMLLQSLGSDNFFRGYEWALDNTKSGILSMLLRKCRPAAEDDAKGLKGLLDKTDIKEKRLIEAAMYAPQWSGIIEEVIDCPGFKKAVWFFQAHISEHFSSDKETEVALYSPISPQRFNDGAFDIKWFSDVYSQLGEKKFRQLYNSAKYLTSGSNAHRRSQLYCDAVTGKLDAGNLEKEIADKRNQEKLRAYGLIPLTEKELLHRYLFINQYIKDSKKFGAQRRESERKAANVALENLAISSGYFDVNRMLWRLEGEKNRELQPLLEKYNVGGYDIALRINEKGEPSLLIEKDGKELKTAPKAIAKDARLEEIKTAVKELKDQRSRGKRTLEEAMINRTVFGLSELENILSSLTVAPMAGALVWKCGDRTGFPQKRGDELVLIDPDGEVISVNKDDELIIAHPHHMFSAGVWSEYIHFAYVEKLIQPFKQIFREYYPITDEEKEERILSRRYAGYQVQPKKTAALLKGQGWTVDYEEGLQKVFYGDDLIVRLYSQADWFSPADIEAPTLEEIRIISRKSGMALPLENVDPVVFSEIMRDLDLVVSVAYVGGVDAETSHSTVEMRIAIAKELALLMKLSNVEFTGRHARIHGKLADYSVHMGSGIVHAAEKGMIPILPVHSQHRGRIFLPFADEDPKTAEIMSKIVLLSEDTKIKDPEILSRLK